MSDKLVDILDVTPEDVKKDISIDVKSEKVELPVKESKLGSSSITDVVMRSIDMDTVSIRGRIVHLKNIIDDSYFEIAGLLYVIYNKRLFYKWGYSCFEDYVNDELNFGRRKADYLRNIWYYFGVELGDSVVLHKIAGIGWTKAKELVNVVTPSNVDDWVEKAGKLNTVQLSSEVRIFKENRMIEEASKASVGIGQVSGGIEPTFRINFLLYEEQYRNVKDALEKAGELGKSPIRSNQLSLMALSFLSSIGFSGSMSKRKEYISKYFKTLGDTMDVDLVVVDRKTNNILLGEEMIGDDDPDIEEIDIEE